MVVEKLELDSELANARRVRQANSDVRRLYHDLKNHLLAIQNLAGDQKELRTYVDSLMPELENYGRQLQTGNEIVDALLSEKMRATANLGIHFHVQMDLRPLSFMQSVDLVSLFGNAIDNAIEAVSSCPDAESRYVYLKSRTQEDMLFLRVENPYTGERSRLAGKLPTGKAQKEYHGIGLDSIEKAVQKYGGMINVEFDNQEKWFILNVMIPLPDQNIEQ